MITEHILHCPSRLVTLTYESFKQSINVNWDTVTFQVGLFLLPVHLNRLKCYDRSDGLDQLNMAFGLSFHTVSEMNLVLLVHFEQLFILLN